MSLLPLPATLFAARSAPPPAPLGRRQAQAVSAALCAMVLVCLASPALAFGEFRVHADDLPRKLLQQVQEAGLGLESGPAIPAFQWRLELKRPLRRAREVQEHYEGSRAGAPLGLSATFRYDYPRTNDTTSDALTARGLVRLSPDDDHIGARVEGLAFPLLVGKSFKVQVRDPGVDVVQQCSVAERVPASQIHARLSGEASLISCEGKGRYKGFDVKMTSTVYFFDVLGMFLNTQDVIDSPLGVLRSNTRIVDLKIAP